MRSMYVINPLYLISVENIENDRGFYLWIKSSVSPFKLKSSRLIELFLKLPVYPNTFSLCDFKLVFDNIFDCGFDNFDKDAFFDELWTFLINNQIIQENHEVAENVKQWLDYNWHEAFVYHYSTKDYPFIDMSKKNSWDIDNDRMSEYKMAKPPPSNYLCLPYEKRYPLNFIDNNKFLSTIENLFQSSNEQLTKEHIGFILSYCYSQRGNLNFGVQGEFIHKLIPSGGARHPIEVFFVSFTVLGLLEGIYLYNTKTNSLDLIKSGNYLEAFKYATFDLFDKYDSPPEGLFLFTALHERPMWRYRESRSFRSLLIDTGIALSVLRRLLLFLKRRSYTYHKFRDKELHELIGLNHISQTILYSATIL